eukprot:scaffold4432_cov108-Skeletonema_dohrnii-CCMP3373.AAC.1
MDDVVRHLQMQMMYLHLHIRGPTVLRRTTLLRASLQLELVCRLVSHLLDATLIGGLTSDGSGEVKVIKKLETNVDIELKFDANFETIAEAQFGQISLESQEDDAQVGNYIDACTCNDKESFTCNTNVLGPDDFLNVCINSAATEMEINYLDSLKMTQGENTLDIVRAEQLVDGTISSMSSVKSKNGVHVATVIPASFFSYNEATSAQ